MAVDKLLIKTVQPDAKQVAYELYSDLEIRSTNGIYDLVVEEYKKDREIRHNLLPQFVVADGEYAIRDFERLSGVADLATGVIINTYLYKKSVG